MSMRRVQAKDWVTAFIESENAEHPRYQPQYAVEKEKFTHPPLRLAIYTLLEMLVVKAVDLIWDSLARRSASRSYNTPKLIRSAADSTPRTSDIARNSNDQVTVGKAYKTDLARVESVPMEAASISGKRTPGVRDDGAPQAEAPLLIKAARHNAARAQCRGNSGRARL
jgi:hypothetical protein